MATQTATQEWIKLPSGRYASAERMQKDGKIFTLYSAANMDVEAFNKEAQSYDVHIENSDPPIDRMIKYAIFLSRKHRDGSFVPTNSEYSDMAIDTASAKGQEQLGSFYKTLINGYLDITREILVFRERIEAGPNKGRYMFTRHVFNEEGRLEPREDIIIAGKSGHIRLLGERHGYPIETSENECDVENLDLLLQGNNAKGYLYLDNEPEKGEQRLALRGPVWGGERLLGVSLYGGRSCSGEYVAALRLREERPQDYEAETREARKNARQAVEELNSIQEGLRTAQERLGRLAGKE